MRLLETCASVIAKTVSLLKPPQILYIVYTYIRMYIFIYEYIYIHILYMTR